MKSKKRFDLISVFKSIVINNPNKIAINFGNNKQYTFRHLDEVSDQILQIFKKLKIKNNDIVAIDSVKNLYSFALIIACIKNHNPYSFIEISKYNHRLLKILKILKPKKIFTFSKKNIGNNYFLNEKSFLKIKKKYLYEKKNILKKNKIAYIMFTSGSTGDPKGVPITHDNLSFFIDWTKKTFGFSNLSVISNLNPLHFDNSVFDIYGGLFNASTIVPFEKTELSYPENLVKKFIETKCDTWFSVPSLLNYILEIEKAKIFKNIKLKNIIFGGERFPINAVRKIYKYLNNTNIFNVSGPTECTCMCSAKKISKKELFESNNLSVGKINNYFKYYILDKNKKKSNEGELILLGPAVSTNYLNETIKNEKKFFKTNKLNGYYTGDIVKEFKRKEIKILGRVDNQIKLMGHRIEIEEIENQIINIFKIKECIIEVAKHSIYPWQKLTCQISVKDKKIKKTFFDKLKNKLPSYMIPKELILREKFKYNKNGKLDRNYNKKLK